MSRHAIKKLRGFTIAELLVVLALTSVSVSLSYATLGYVQHLFSDYRNQNRFVNEYSDFKRRMDHEALTCKYVSEEGENQFLIHRDSVAIRMKLGERYILLQQQTHCDTFHFEAKNLKRRYEFTDAGMQGPRLIRKLSFETSYSRQKFLFCFEKTTDASIKLKLQQRNDGRH